MAVEIRQHEPGKDLEHFIRLPHQLFKDDPLWVPPLNMEITDRLTPGRNPFFEHADVTLFTAWKDGQPVGRVSAQIDREHLKRWQDSTGFFGFFDTTNDKEVGSALIDAAGKWLRERGMKRIRGPLSLNVNEELGVLVDGFDTPPMVMMSHSLPYQGQVAEAAGLEKVKDLYAWRFDIANPHPRALRAWEQIKAMPEVEFRTIKRSSLDREIRTILEVYNDAWRDNWGYVEATEAEGKKLAEDLKLVIVEEMVFTVFIEGKPAAICMPFPNLNEAIRDLNGKLFPFGILKLLWRLKVKHPKSARVVLMGIKKEYRNRKRYGGLALAIAVEIAQRGKKLGYEWAEVGWTLEDNTPINLTIRAMGCKLYKKYRIYEKSLEA